MKNNNRIIIFGISLILLFLVSFVSTTNVKAITPAEIFDDVFDETIQAFVEDTGGNCLQMGIINDTEIVHMNSYGATPSNETVHNIGRLSEILTVLAVMILYENNSLHIDDDINDYLPYSLRNPNYLDDPITVFHLLTQRASINFESTTTYWETMLNGSCSFPDTLYENLHINGTYYSIQNWKVEKPGINTEVAPICFDLLAYIIELVSGISYGEYVTENILTPLNMLDTKLNYSEYDPSRLGIPTAIFDNGSIVLPHRNYDGRGNIGWWSTIEDYIKVMYLLLNEGSYNGIQIVNGTTINSIMTNHGESVGMSISNYELRGKIFRGLDIVPWGFPISTGFYGALLLISHVGFLFLCDYFILTDSLESNINEFMDFWISRVWQLFYTPDIPETPEPSNLYLLPVLSSIALLTIFTIKRRKLKI